MSPTRQKLIIATETLLRRDGLARITTPKIAREAGVATEKFIPMIGI
jgi:AcrR family transcriptional regulator